ncbi:MAG TPA: indolepyruvate oxidoreductase subunit beta [Longimicrobiales bacterium]|nr:indolepyruvate oxidoreductase subunit beta [Longimicrobiales bacterium]
MSVTNIVLAGVGGQGSVLATKVLGRAASNAGLRVVTSELHGMSQRGGTVITTVRYGSEAWSPAIPQGEADYLVAFEQLEAARHLDWLRPCGVLIMNDQRIRPTSESLRRAAYPEDIGPLTDGRCRECVEVPALAIAKSLGNPRLASSVVLGALSLYLEFPEDAWLGAIGASVPPATVQDNIEAFLLGAAWRRARERAVLAF